MVPDNNKTRQSANREHVSEYTVSVNTLRPRQNGRHFADDTFERTILNENVWTSINISLKFVPKGPINNIPLSEPMIVRLPTHICVSRPQFNLWLETHIRIWVSNDSYLFVLVDTSPPWTNGRNFAKDILTAFSWMEFLYFAFGFYGSLFLKV